jgi:hypothetical protein
MVRKIQKIRHTEFNKVCGECVDVGEQTLANWVPKLP